MTDARPPFYTVGHSNRSLQDFIDLVASVGVGFVVDIRKMPMSRANPQFSGEPLAEALRLRGIGYEHAARLGGLVVKPWRRPCPAHRALPRGRWPCRLGGSRWGAWGGSTL